MPHYVILGSPTATETARARGVKHRHYHAYHSQLGGVHTRSGAVNTDVSISDNGARH